MQVDYYDRYHKDINDPPRGFTDTQLLNDWAYWGYSEIFPWQVKSALDSGHCLMGNFSTGSSKHAVVIVGYYTDDTYKLIYMDSWDYEKKCPEDRKRGGYHSKLLSDFLHIFKFD